MKTTACLALLAALCLLLSAAAFADISGNYEYRLLPGGGAEVTRYLGSNKDLKIPAVLGGAAVTRIGDHAFAWSRIRSVILPDSVTELGTGAFANCASLAGITLPDALVSLGEYAFYRCSTLAEIRLPAGVTALPKGVFSHCYSLRTFEAPEGVAVIGEKAFSWCESLENVFLPAGVTAVGDAAFADCEKLAAVTVVPGSYAEAYCQANGLSCAYPEPAD